VKLSARGAVGLAARDDWEPPRSTWASPARCFGFRFWRSIWVCDRRGALASS